MQVQDEEVVDDSVIDGSTMTYQSRGNDWLDLAKVAEQANVTTAIGVARGDARLRWRESRPMVARPSLAQGRWADGERYFPAVGVVLTALPSGERLDPRRTRGSKFGAVLRAYKSPCRPERAFVPRRPVQLTSWQRRNQ